MKFFITGTDTGVGKTYISTLLLRHFNAKGFSTFGIKPIASGCRRVNCKLYNDDALILQRSASVKMPYNCVNPIALELPIAPHIALKMINRTLSQQELSEKMNYLFLKISADVFIIEGVGGWFVPLNETELIADWVKLIKIPVILVVGIKLGCLNHAILTVKAMVQEKISLFGWIANCLDPQILACNENIQTLKEWIDAPCLGVISYGENEGNNLVV